MKKLLGIAVLGLGIVLLGFLLNNNSSAKEINLECGVRIAERILYAKVDKKTLEIYIPSTDNRLKFKVDVFDDYKIQTYGRSLNKSKTKYDTHLTIWKWWDLNKHIRDYGYMIIIDRVQGKIIIARSKNIFEEGKTDSVTFVKYDELSCKKLEKF